MLKVGNKAPEFSLPANNGKRVRLRDFRGKNVVLYFYPKDETPGCTREACSFQEQLSALSEKGAIVLGVSADSVESHRAFAQHYGLTFLLLSDESKTVLKKYGVWKKKTMFGKTFMGIERTTFLIDAQGRIARVFPRVRVETLVEEVLRTLETLDASASE
jgi:peroxiredoxin Q/BCP